MEKSRTVYETERLELRSFGELDMTDEYFSWFYDEDVTRHNSHGLFPYTKKQQKDFLQSIENQERIVWAAYTKSGIQIGNVDLTSFNWINRSCELTIVIGNKEYWGKGYGKEMCSKIIEHGFKKLNMHRIWTGTAETNTGMKTLAGSLGMTLEGGFRDGKYQNGTYHNILVYGILRNEWRIEQNA